MGFGLVIRFIEQLQVVTTSACSAIAKLHSAIHYGSPLSLMIFTGRFLAMDPNSVLC
jgi:hypothetical protein